MQILTKKYSVVVAFNLLPIHAVLVFSFMIVNMGPYRRFLIRIMKKTIRMNVSETSSTAEADSKIIRNGETRRQTIDINAKRAW